MEALTFAGTGDVDEFHIGEDIGQHGLPQLELGSSGVVIETQFFVETLGRGLGFRIMTNQGHGGKARSHILKAELNGRVAIRLRSLDLGHHAGTNLQHRDRNILSVFGVVAGHANFSAENKGGHQLLQKA